MPELPEIETVKLQLQKVLVGQKLIGVNILTSKIVQGKLEELIGREVLVIRRLGKVLLIDFGPDLALGFHFKMTGQLIYDDGKTRIAGGHPSEDFVAKLPNTHTRVVFEFDQSKLFFNDMRMFGWVQINPKFTDKQPNSC
jgi:formamidopyrimidine-DNA glycosylase